MKKHERPVQWLSYEHLRQRVTWSWACGEAFGKRSLLRPGKGLNGWSTTRPPSQWYPLDPWRAANDQGGNDGASMVTNRSLS